MENLSENLSEKFPDRDAFDRYWNESYQPLSYEDVKEEFEKFVTESEKHIFDSDYEAAGAITREDFKENLSQTAEFTFQDTLTEAFYEKNPELYETAFTLYEEAVMNDQGENNVAMTFHEEYEKLYNAFLEEMFQAMFA